MSTMLERFYRNPAVMVPWCKAVGLDPERIPVAPFSIEHKGDDQHVAHYVLCDPPAGDPGPGLPMRRVVDVLPFPCALHPDVPAIGTADGLAKPLG